MTPAQEGFVPKLKQFGNKAQRVTSDELQNIVNELRQKIGQHFLAFEPVKSLASKPNHGDIDILVVPTYDISRVLAADLNGDVLDYRKNGPTHSFLYRSDIGKTVHIDLIVSKDLTSLQTKLCYYSLNDFSAIVGIVAKKLHFKYGTEGFFKRFQDKKGIWHDLLITEDLMLGLEILGFSRPNYYAISSPDDIIQFILENPMVDSKFFERDNLDARDRQSENLRPMLQYILDTIRSGIRTARTIDDEDHFFKSLCPDLYQKVEDEKIEINNRTYQMSCRYDGHWVMKEFGLRPGPQIGKILKAMSDRFTCLDTASEDEVADFVNSLI